MITPQSNQLTIHLENLFDYSGNTFFRLVYFYGLPDAIRTDNGVPFASGNALFGLTKLSVWWLRLGIQIERIRPGHPEQNGRHERIHLTLKKEATQPAGDNFLQQQEKFDTFIEEYNHQRPHQALDMMMPAELYPSSQRRYQGLPEVDYPFHDKTVTVTHCGKLCFNGLKVNLSVVLAGQNVGVKEVQDRVWLVSFMDYDLGFFDEESARLEPAMDPFGSKVLPMSSVYSVTHVFGMHPPGPTKSPPHIRFILIQVSRRKSASFHIIFFGVAVSTTNIPISTNSPL